MGDEDHRQVELLSQLLEEVEDLRLDRHVEAGDRFICDQEIGADGECASNRDPLSLTSGQLTWETTREPSREAHHREELLDEHVAAPFVDAPVNAPRFQDRALDREAGVERRIWVLKDHLHPSMECLARFPVASAHVDAIEVDGSFVRLVKTNETARERTLARARLADDAQRRSLA